MRQRIGTGSLAGGLLVAGLPGPYSVRRFVPGLFGWPARWLSVLSGRFSAVQSGRASRETPNPNDDCDGGQLFSRGTLLAVDEGLSLELGLDVVREARPRATPHPALHTLAVLYVAAEG